MNRRRFLAGAGITTLGTVTGYGGLRIADIRPYDPALPTGESPRESITAAAQHRHAADHRAVTNVRVLDDWTGETPYDLDVRKLWHQPSRRRHLHTLTTFETPLTQSNRLADAPDREYVTPHQTLWALLHYNRVLDDGYDLPLTNVRYITDGAWLYDHDAPTPAGDAVRVSDDRSGHIPNGDYERASKPVRRDLVRPHQTDWTRTAADDETITYRVVGADAYAQVVPLPFAPISGFGDCWIEVTLDRKTGRLRRIVNNRAVDIDLQGGAGERSLTYRIETDIDRYGDVRARRPAGSVNGDFESHVKALLFDLVNY